MQIRPYEPRDFEDCRDICYVTADPKQWNTEKKKKILWNLYCDYYVNEEPDVCFVVADENDRAIGYILCAKDHAAYIKRYKEKYYKPLKKLSCAMGIFKFFEMRVTKKYTEEYPAHLHIDIKPEGQRQGFGHKLVDALAAALRQQGIPGVQLGVGAKNEKGVSFYKKYGFTELDRQPGTIVFGLRIDKQDAKR